MKNFFKKIFGWLKDVFSREGNENTPKPPILLPEEPEEESTKHGRLDALSAGDHGIDISHHNKNVNVATIAKNEKFIFMKATEGKDLVSPVYHARIDKALGLGATCSAYHYYKTNVPWQIQADHFLKHFKGNMSPVLDVEGIGNLDYDAKKHTPQVLLFLRYLKEKTGMTPIMYCGYYFARDTIKPTQEFSEFPLWLPWYTKDFSKVKTPLPWRKISIHQYSESEVVEGVGKCDANIFLGL